MTNDFMSQFGKFSESAEKFFGPMREMATLNVDYLEKVAELQMDAAKAYADLGLKQVRAATSVSDVQGLQDYVKAQGETVNTVSKRVQEDAQKVVTLSKDYADKAQKLAQSNASSFVPATAAK
ncbi:phasin family protein [Ectothiorhodospiraceae bacterium WFHF3C12]|nr:phasin family protein [Ectothiorhodospiraceae bacterium WFHF3C12]